ncbi:MAG: molybdopterin converting factor subunit 1 [Myxococcales bacterium]|nr:molybdopterin converting factor subunit 1 [Myxococcales bacterium]
MITVTVKYFAGLREAVGMTTEEFKFNEPPRVRDALDRIFAAHRPLSAYRASLLLAVNLEYADADTLLADGDELALIPPVSGGSR